MGHVDTDLVGAAGFQLAAHVGITPVTGYYLPMGNSLFAVSLGDAHLFPVGGVAANGGIHRAAVFPERAADDGFVGAGHRMVFQLRCQNSMGKVIFGYRQKTGGVLINAVDNAGAQHAVDAGKGIGSCKQQAVDQGVVIVTGSRVNSISMGRKRYCF